MANRGSTPSAGQRELVVIARSDAGLRAGGAAVASIADADVTSLNSLLTAHSATMQPLFGLSEDRLRARALAAAPSSETDGNGKVPDEIEELTRFYRVDAPDERLDRLQSDLLAHDLVDAAYVKPPAEPPQVVMEKPAAINDMQPDAADAPPATPNLASRQIYLTAAPAGIDAL